MPAVLAVTPPTLVSRAVKRDIPFFSVMRAFVSVLFPAPLSPTMNTLIAGGVGVEIFLGRNSLYIFLEVAPFFSKHLMISVSLASARGVQP